MAKVFYEKEDGGQTVLKNYTTTATSAPYGIRTVPGVGEKFWYWLSVNNVAGVIGCDFTTAPIVSASPAENYTAINAITTTPEEVLIWAPA